MRTLDTRQTVGLGIAAVIVVVVAALVAVFGIVPFPDTPRLADQPEPQVPGRLAYLSWDDGESCLHVVDGAGNDLVLTCDPDHGGEGLRWTEDGYIALTVWSVTAREERIIDPATGDTVEVREAPELDELGRVPEPGDLTIPPHVRADGTEVRVDSRAGKVEIAVGRPGEPREVVWEAVGPERYRLEQPSWSPDGEWLLVRDSRGHLLVLGADGDPAPRIWVEDAGWQYAWYIRGVGGSSG